MIEIKAGELEVFGDSELVIDQLNGEYKCKHITMAGYYIAVTQLLAYQGDEVTINHITRELNLAVNEMAHLASKVQAREIVPEEKTKIQTRNLPSIFEKGFNLDVMTEEPELEDWRTPIIQYLKDHSLPTCQKTRRHATKLVLQGEILLKKPPYGLLLKCLGLEKSMRVMVEVHQGIYRAHQAGTKMRWLLRGYGYFWPNMEKDVRLMQENVKNARDMVICNIFHQGL